MIESWDFRWENRYFFGMCVGMGEENYDKKLVFIEKKNVWINF